MMSRAAVSVSLQRELGALITREIAGIAAIDAAIPHASPDYVVMFQGAKNGKQANVEQLATIVRIQGDAPDENGGVRKALTRSQAAITARVSTTMMLRTMRLAEIELVNRYSETISRAHGVMLRALAKVLARAMVHAHLLTAHLAMRTGSKTDPRVLLAPLTDYFARGEARACMRCHLDRPGVAHALERRDPHPYTYICGACHDDVLGEFPPDLAVQMDAWPREVREAKVMQHAIGRVSKLNAIGRVLYPLAGLAPDLPTPAAERAVVVPAMTPTPGPAPGERSGVVTIDYDEGPEGDYVRALLAVRETWQNW